MRTRSISTLILFFLLLAPALSLHADSAAYKSREAKHKHKDKKGPPPGPTQKPQTMESVLQELFDYSNEKARQAYEKETSLTRTFKNAAEVSSALRSAADLYDAASQAIRELLKITVYVVNKNELENLIKTTAAHYDLQAKRCRTDAAEWIPKVEAKRRAVYEEVARLKQECKSDNPSIANREAYRRLIYLQQKLIENGEPDTGEVAANQASLASLNAQADVKRQAYSPPKMSHEEFRKREVQYKNAFFDRENRNDLRVYAATPLDGDELVVYEQQFYRFLIQRDAPAHYLNVKVFEDGQQVHEEQILIPSGADAWERYLVTDEMLNVPKSDLSLLYGLDLRLSVINDPYSNFSLVVAQKGSTQKYDYSFFLDDQPLYDVHFSLKPPWQLEALKKPGLLSIKAPLLPVNSNDIAPAADDGARHALEALTEPMLNAFVNELKSDPLALARYVHNEIETVDPFLKRHEGVFKTPSIHRNPLRTFLENQGSPWEQCTLLVYLLRQAGYPAQYIEGRSSLPARQVEELLYLQLPEEQEVSLDYPGVLFFDGQKWHTLFPWLKEIHTNEGYELYSLLPDEYGNAERWLMRYLCNDENIFKHVGPDGDDTAAVIFVKFVEEHLRKQGLSLQDVGIHRTIHKKQFHTWAEFPRPLRLENPKALANLAMRNDLFARIKVAIHSEQNPERKFTCEWMVLPFFSCGSYAIYFTPNSYGGHYLNFSFPDHSREPVALPLDATDSSISVEVEYETLIGSEHKINDKKQFTILKGTCAALCYQFGNTNANITTLFADKYAATMSAQDKLNALCSFVGAAYFEKCSRSSKILASLHKVIPTTYFCAGLSKLSPDHGSISDLRFPQVDMHYTYFLLDQHRHPFSPHTEGNSAANQSHLLLLADVSSNEHQVLREIYQDPYAISTVKLLQIAHKRHVKQGGAGPGFLAFTKQRFFDADLTPGLARTLYFSNLAGIDLVQIKGDANTQWESLRKAFDKDHAYTYAYMTPGPVSSEDGFGIIPPSYTGMGTLINTGKSYAALISSGMRTMNGGYGSRLPNNFMETIGSSEWKLASNGSSFSFIASHNAPLFNGVTSTSVATGYQLPGLTISNESSQFTLWKDTLWSPVSTQWKADVRLGHKSTWDTVADPVDVVTGAFYVDEADLNIPGAFPLEVRRNYNSQNPIPGIFGFGWKLSLNPFLFEEGEKLLAAEQDGTVIVYRKEQQNRWIVSLEDNPDLRNFNKNGIGGTANPFHAYIEKDGDHILYGGDGSKRVFHDMLLITWADHAGNSLTFSYKDRDLTRIESSSGGYISFEYNHGGKIASAYAKDGRKISYTYDFQGNLASVTLPNDAVTKYEYDRFHRIIRETKPHGRVLENIYQDDKVVEQRSPVGPGQYIIPNATFAYADGVTWVTDAVGGRTEYKIYKKQIYKIVDPNGSETLQSWFLDSQTYFDAETELVTPWTGSGAYPRSLKSSRDKRGLITNYLYDDRGNHIEIALVGADLTGNGDQKVLKTFRHDERNLCVEEVTLHTKTVTSYDSAFPFLPKRIDSFADDKLISFFEVEYTSHGLIRKENRSGAITLFEYDERDFPITKTQKTGTDDPDVVTSFKFNDQGQCIELVTDDAIQRNEYDIMGNKYCSQISLPSGKVFSKTYCGYDLNNELVWRQGDDPHDTTFFDYTASGLLKATRQSLSPTGTAYTLYEYDACGHLIEQVDALGNTTYCSYDALGRVLSSTKDGLTTLFSYEPGGFVSSITRPSGASVSRDYTTNGLLKREVRPDGTQHCFFYDHFGRPIQEIQNGIVTTVRYDDAALIQEQCRAGETEVRQYDSRGNLIRLTDAAGYVWKKTYDALDRPKSEVAPNGDTTTWNYHGDTITCTLPTGEKTVQRFEAGALAEVCKYDASGSLVHHICYNKFPSQNMTEEIHGDIVMTTWKNSLGLPVRIQQGDKVTTHHYDALGNCIATVDGDNNVMQQKFDPSGRLIEKILPDGAIITYEYDADSNLIAYRMPDDVAWKASYDGMGRKVCEWQESKGKTSQRWEYVYSEGLIVKTTDPLNRVHEYAYDAQARLINEAIGKHVRVYAYDPRGLLTSVMESGNDTSKVERDYDALGRLVDEKITLNGVLMQHTEQSWTPSSRQLQIGKHERVFDYQHGQLKRLSSNGFDLFYEYAESGSLIGKKSPFTSVELRYNASALPETVAVKLSGKQYTESIQWNPSGKLVSHLSSYPEVSAATYAYSYRGHLKSDQTGNYTFDFDHPGRGILTGMPGMNVEEKDDYGRVISELIGDKANQMAYDEIGQVVSNGDMQIVWDPWGRVTSVTNDGFIWKASYDALGRRLETSYTPLSRYYLFTPKGKVVVTKSYFDPQQEFQEIGVACGTNVFWKFFGSVSCDAVIDAKGEAVALHHDIRNNLVAVVGAQKTYWTKDYPTPYGPRGPPSVETSDVVSYALSLSWQSRRVDPTGFVWLGARYYNPSTGRFLSTDPISHPVCLDLYAYANGDPINNVDLDGRFASAAYDTVPSSNINSRQTSSLPKITINYSNKWVDPLHPSRPLDLGRPELPSGNFSIFVNGIQNTVEDALKSAEYLSDMSGGYNVHVAYCGKLSLSKDLESCFLALNYIDTGMRAVTIFQTCNKCFNLNPDAYILLNCHSRGCIDTRNALLMLPEEKWKRITVVAIAPAGYIYRETCAKVTHYRAENYLRDPVPYWDQAGAEREASTIVNLRSAASAPLNDHPYSSPTYYAQIKYEIDQHIESRGILR